MKKLIVKGLATATTFAALSTAAFAECGEYQMAEMNWASAELMANVDKIPIQVMDIYVKWKKCRIEEKMIETCYCLQ